MTSEKRSRGSSLPLELRTHNEAGCVKSFAEPAGHFALLFTIRVRFGEVGQPGETPGEGSGKYEAKGTMLTASNQVAGVSELRTVSNEAPPSHTQIEE
jgi:hypothetical protein